MGLLVACSLGGKKVLSREGVNVDTNQLEVVRANFQLCAMTTFDWECEGRGKQSCEMSRISINIRVNFFHSKMKEKNCILIRFARSNFLKFCNSRCQSEREHFVKVHFRHFSTQQFLRLENVPLSKLWQYFCQLWLATTELTRFPIAFLPNHI